MWRRFQKIECFHSCLFKDTTSQDTADTAKDDLIAYAMTLGYLERNETPKRATVYFTVWSTS